MKLSDLIKYRNDIAAIPYGKLAQEISAQASRIKEQLLSVSVDSDLEIELLMQSLGGLTSSSSQVSFQLNLFIQRLQKYIDQVEKLHITESEKIYQASLTDPDDYVLDKTKRFEETLSNGVQELFESRIKMYTSWRYPGMQLRPAAGTWTKHMIDCDPLYLVDFSEKLFEPIKKQFNTTYQKRLRYCTIDKNQFPCYNAFPKNQFGIIVANYFFNQTTTNAIKQHLKELWGLLRPGGVIIFTYNNCDLEQSVVKFENGYDCYCPARAIIPMVRNIGFELLAEFNESGVMQWIEIARPGQIQSIRGGQSLAKIMNKPEKT